MIRIGIAGIPLSCKERTYKDGVIYTRNLGLSALEIQLSRGVVMEESKAKETGEIAKQCDIELSLHAPYYLNFAGRPREMEMSFEKMNIAGAMAQLLDAKTMVVHPGFYGNHSKKETLLLIIQNLRLLRDDFKSKGIETNIGIETMGKKDVFGSLDEIAETCHHVAGIVPVLDFGHIHARGNGCLQNTDDFYNIFKKMEGLSLTHYLSHITGVAYNNAGALYHLPIRKGDLSFMKLMEVILENNYNITLISESPILEHDAVYTQILLDRAMELSK